MKYKLIWCFIFFVISSCLIPITISSATENQVIARDGTFVAYNNGVVRDTRTGLEWIAGPDRDMNWKEVRTWVQELAVGGGGWRMPTTVELKTLYNRGAGSSNMTPLLKMTGQRVWTNETKDSTLAWTVSFFFGDENWVVLEDAYLTRGFAVRSPK